MFNRILILTFALIFMSFQCLCAQDQAVDKEVIKERLRAMGLKKSQIEKVLAGIEEQKSLNQNQPSEDIERPAANDEPKSTTGTTENVDSTETAEDADSTLPEIFFTGKPETPDAPYRINQDEKPFHVDTPDTGKLLMRIPGANVNSNGPITGIPQRRGQSYSSGRVNE